MTIKSIRRNISIFCQKMGPVKPIDFAALFLVELLDKVDDAKVAEDIQDYPSLAGVLDSIARLVDGHEYSKESLIALVKEKILNSYSLDNLRILIPESKICRYPSSLEYDMVYSPVAIDSLPLRSNYGEEDYITAEQQKKIDDQYKEERKKRGRKKKISADMLDEAVEEFRSLYRDLGNARLSQNNQAFFSGWSENDISIPHYAWQWNFSQDEYKEIKELITDYSSHLGLIASKDTVCCKLIQLYVSEWYKREFNGNTGDGNALTSIEANITAKDICNGLGIDETNVYTSQNTGSKPTSEWIKTLYVDGGLPLNYLQNKGSGLKESIVEIIDKGTSDLGTLCNDQVVNQSYIAHDNNDSEASIYDFVEAAILGDDFTIDGFEQFEDIIHEAKRKLRPKFYFECFMSQVDETWYRSFNLTLKKGSSLETTNYFDYSRVKDWLPGTAVNVREASWCDIMIYTKNHPEAPVQTYKAVNNFAGKFFIPDNNLRTTLSVTGDDVIDSIKIRFEGMPVPIDLKQSEYVVDEFSRVQLDEVQPGFWAPHKDRCGFKSAVFYCDTDEQSYEIDDECFYHDTEIDVYDNLKMHKIDVLGVLRFTDGVEYHSAAHFDVKPNGSVCRLISFKEGNRVSVIDQYGNTSESILLVIDKNNPKDCYSLYFYGEERPDLELIGFDLEKSIPYQTNLVISGENMKYELGPAVIIPADPTQHKTPMNVAGKHNIRINCTSNGEHEIIEIENSEKDYFDYTLLLSDGCKVILSLLPPFYSYDIIQRSPRKLLNSFEYMKEVGTDYRFMELIAKESQNLSFCFNKPSRSYAKSFYIRSRKRKKDIEWMPFRGHVFSLKANVTKTCDIEDVRFLVDPELEIVENNISHPLTCENYGSGFYRFTYETEKYLIRHAPHGKIEQKDGEHLQLFTNIHVSGRIITLTMLK